MSAPTHRNTLRINRRTLMGGAVAGSLIGAAGTALPSAAVNGRRPVLPAPPAPPPSLPHDWSEANPPWAYTSTSVFTQGWPSGTKIVDLAGSGQDLYTRLNATLNANSGRIVARLPAGVFTLDRFRKYGSGSGNLYAFGFFFERLQGLLGAGPDRTFVEMKANSLSSAQLSEMANLNPDNYAPLHLGMARLDGTQSSPVLLAGVTFRAADQQMLRSKHPNLNVALPQPAPHQGVLLYSHSDPLGARVSYVRFQGAARALNSQPPFECANVQSGRGYVTWTKCEFDGRRSPALDAARPRRCAPVMLNSEYKSEFIDCWFHHSNLSRYAANDQNRPINGEYIVTRSKFEHITNNRNTDPNLNNGNSLGGYTNATPLGWESCAGKITIRDCILHQDNPNPTSGTGQIPMMFQLTSVGSRDPRGGRLYSYGGQYNWVHGQLDGFIGLRISPNTYWWRDGFNTTLFIHHPTTQARLSPHVVEGVWPPTAQALEAAGVRSTTHYLIRRT